ncbi:phosphohydrolase [Microbacterium sp. NPDC087868]|uniref:phosphohydrolase n=1 Tax=Microbacterium sp. NPDC087868 TaxID=3364195 RepID=UPI0038500A84
MAEAERAENEQASTEELLAAWSERSGGEQEAWTRARPGPALDAIAARLSAVPQMFLDDRVSVRALGGDVLGMAPACVRFAGDERVRRGAAIALWIVASEELVAPFSSPVGGGAAALAVDALALRLAPVSDPLSWISDDERRIEAARTFLLWRGYLPEGEDAQTASSLLAAVDSLARDKALADAYEGHRHRAEIARKLQEARRKEAAARYSSE